MGNIQNTNDTKTAAVLSSVEEINKLHCIFLTNLANARLSSIGFQRSKRRPLAVHNTQIHTRSRKTAMWR